MRDANTHGGTVAALVCLCALLGTHAAIAGVHEPDVEARLAALVGDWTLDGQRDTFREVCEWYGDRAFVVCRSEDTADGSSGVSILGYSTAERRFTYHHYSHRGTSRSEAGFPQGTNGIVYTAERTTQAGVVRTTTALTPAAGGRLHFRQERSVNGGAWTVSAEFHYVPRVASDRR